MDWLSVSAVEHLLCRCEALTLNPSPTKKKGCCLVVQHLPSMHETLKLKSQYCKKKKLFSGMSSEAGEPV
jgi:hypothetical protein